MSKISFVLSTLLLLAAVGIAMRGERNDSSDPWYLAEVESLTFDTVAKSKPVVRRQPIVVAPASEPVVAPPTVSPTMEVAEPLSLPAAEPSDLPVPAVVVNEPPSTESSVPTELDPPEPLVAANPAPELPADDPQEEMVLAPPTEAASPESPVAPEVATSEPATEPELNTEPTSPPGKREDPLGGSFNPLATTLTDDPQSQTSKSPTEPLITRLPEVSPLALEDLVLHAGGAVELRPPAGWKVYEVPIKREIRLVLVPERLKSKRKTPTDGVWLTCHITANNADQRKQEISSWSQERLDQATDSKAKSSPPFERSISGHPAVVREFVVPVATKEAPKDKDDKEDDAKTVTEESLRGVHALVGAPWGLCELVAMAPESVYDQRRVEFERLLNEIVISRPDSPAVAKAESASAAESIYGVWKSTKSRMRILSDGRIEIDGDPMTLHPLGEVPAEGKSSFTPERLRGRYTAKDDLLKIIWEDGSKLNFRWKKKDAQLLLTDHQGQISRLRRILE